MSVFVKGTEKFMGFPLTKKNRKIPTDGIPVVSYDRNTNRITNGGFQYDYNGNQTRAFAPDGVTWLNYEYDAANRIQIIKKDDGTYLQAFQTGSTNARLMDMVLRLRLCQDDCRRRSSRIH